MIRETIVTSCRPDGSAHIAPMGIHIDSDDLILAPFKPSQTLDNLLRDRCAVINYTDDVRVFAGSLCGRYDWPVCAAEKIDGLRLQYSLAHVEVVIDEVRDDPLRPRLTGRRVFEQVHAPFAGFNRAQAAVIEAAILVSRLDRLPRQKIEQEIAYLEIAVSKTAGEREHEAWSWLMRRVTDYLGATPS